MARPTIKAVLFGAAAQTKLPNSKIAMVMRKVVFSGKYLYAFPHVDWKAPKVRKKADPYHPT